MNSKKLAHEAGHIVFVHPSLMGGGAERVSLALALSNSMLESLCMGFQQQFAPNVAVVEQKQLSGMA